MMFLREIEAESEPAKRDEEAGVRTAKPLPEREEALAAMERIQSESLATVLEIIFGKADES